VHEGENKASESTNVNTSKKDEADDNTAKNSVVLCHDCGKEITGRGSASAEVIVGLSTKAYGFPLCVDCGKTRKEDAENAGDKSNGAEKET
jgi:hypothetical protein